MATVEITREHSLGKDAAKERAQQMADKLASKLDAQCSWQDDELTFKRSGVDGSILVGEDSVRVAVKLGMMLTPMAGMVKGEIEKALNRYLA
ncbi:polyhydroxyalkanoic acid system family protein [Pseudomonas sp. MYb185]|uniref:polyhydroxyalkanoic acid system family protein n=1 Tax=Pseudomonas sp. MYb185 TaxID=1848729 RepID=UPI000CFB9BB9|nr:polyhydroxyalkanoic acid system family protein [Pseudomonas sp. MYb185]PRB83003.1 polyhydroxyalkanoic acid system protein [Pseudomonas sp. MYb185]